MLFAKGVVDQFFREKTAMRNDEDNRISHEIQLPGSDLRAVQKFMDNNSAKELDAETIECFINYLILNDLHDKR